MPGYQPKIGDTVWWDGENVNTFTTDTGLGIRIAALRGWDDSVDIRDVREHRSGQDGERVDTVFLSGRSVTISGQVFASSWTDLQARKRALSAVFRPSSAEVLLQIPEPSTAADPDVAYSASGIDGFERVTARVIEPIVFGDLHGPSVQEFQVIVRASDPRRYEDVELVVTTDEISTDGGMSFPMDFPLAFETAGVGGTVDVVNSGSTDAPWVARVYGPITNPIVEDSSGLGGIVFDGLVIPDGDFIEIDAVDRTVFLNGDEAESRYTFVDFGATYWWLIPPGSSTIRLRGSTVSDPASLQIRFRSANL